MKVGFEAICRIESTAPGCGGFKPDFNFYFAYDSVDGTEIISEYSRQECRSHSRSAFVDIAEVVAAYVRAVCRTSVQPMYAAFFTVRLDSLWSLLKITRTGRLTTAAPKRSSTIRPRIFDGADHHT